MSKLYIKILHYLGAITLLSITALSGFYIHGQEPPVFFDSVFVPLGRMVVVDDSVLRFPSDTTILIPHNTHYKVKKDKEYRSDEFYGNFKDKSKGNVFLKGIYGVAIREQKDTVTSAAAQKEENYHPELTDKTIGRIDIISVDLVDGDVNDPSVRAGAGYAVLLNKMHNDTRENTIKKNLTIREGDRLGAYTLSDNEYHLRSLDYIEDVKIYAATDSINPEVVNVLVVVKDVFPFTVGFSMGGITDYTLSLNHINMVGSGNEFANAFNYNSSKDQTLGYKGQLKFNNLWGSFIDAELQYRNNDREILTKFTLEREFLTPETKYGGGIELFNQKTTVNIMEADTVYVTVPYTKNYFDQWVGRSFLLDNINRWNIIVKGRYMATRFTERPLVESDTLQQFYNINLLIGSITLLKKNHYKERMLLGYGMVEDIDYGYAFELTYGYQFSEYFEAPYVGLSIKTASKYNFGYLGGGVEYGGHFYKDSFVQGLFRAAASYYSPLLKAGFFDYRLITRWSYTEGIRRYDYEILNLGKEVRGVSNSAVNGEKRLVARFELATFLKGSVIGFRFSPNLFYDASFLSPGGTLFSADNYFSVAGAGVRIRNENLAFRTIILRFGYYTGNPIKAAHWGVGFTTSVPDVFRDYEIARPDVLKY